MIVAIPGGEATLRDTLTIKERRTLRAIATSAMELAQKAGANEALNTADADFMLATQDRLADATLLAFLVSWTLDKPLPTADTIGEMDGNVYDAISKAIEDHGGAFGIDTSPTVDKSSPTNGSLGSGTSSKGEPTPTLQSTSS
jgi:hypothetical protein